MAKKLSLLLAAVAVLAFAIPSMASAAEATLPAGTLAPVGTEITATGKNVTLNLSTLGNITCATLNLNGKITKNDGTTVEGSGETSAPTQSGCNNGAERPITVTRTVITRLRASGTGSGTKSAVVAFSTVWDFPAGVVCNFTGTNVAGTYVSGTNVLKFANATGISSTGGCGTAKLTGEFALEKAGTSTPLILD
jgi:hypothetical protein